MLAVSQLLSPPLPWPLRRRFAAGVDLGVSEARLVVLSRGGERAGPVRVEWLGEMALECSAMAGGEIADRAAVARAVAALFSQWPRYRAVRRRLSCAMAVPGSATIIDSLPLSHPFPHPSSRLGEALHQSTIDAMEAAVYAHAERLAGIERRAIAVDWFVDEGNCGCAAPVSASPRAAAAPHVTIAATARHYLEARIEVAASAGIALRAVDGELPAALRALCHVAEHELREAVPFAAIWFGGDGMYGWRVTDEAVQASVRYPAPEHPDLEAALCTLAAGQALGCAVVGGDLGRLTGCGVSLADISRLLGCAVRPFECTPFLESDTHASLASACHWACAPSFAVAFGLALRGVRE
jgi:Tfp pilus assembly PilM family ATPase